MLKTRALFHFGGIAAVDVNGIDPKVQDASGDLESFALSCARF